MNNECNPSQMLRLMQVRLAEQLQGRNVTVETVNALMALRTKAAADQETDIRIDFSQANQVCDVNSDIALIQRVCAFS